MGISKLAHYSIRTTDLEASRRFYTELLGFRTGFRPPFPFPGLWLYLGTDESDYGTVHIIGIDPNDPSGLMGYLGDRAEGEGTGKLDHIAFLATDWPSLRKRCDEGRVPYQERRVPALGLHQVFLIDPSGITIELNYPSAD